MTLEFLSRWMRGPLHLELRHLARLQQLQVSRDLLTDHRLQLRDLFEVLLRARVAGSGLVVSHTFSLESLTSHILHIYDLNFLLLVTFS